MYEEDTSFDRVKLECNDQYAKYISKMFLVFKMLMNVYSLKLKRDNEASEESEVVLYYINKLLHTFEALRYKYIFNPTSSLTIDKSDSGFVNFSEIMGIETDIPFKEKKLNSFDDEYEIKQRMLSHMLRYNEESKKDLEAMGSLRYFQHLDEEKLFLFFNPGSLTTLDPQEGNDNRRYSYHWACYDKSSNMPYIYFIEFEQAVDSIPLEENQENAERFYSVIKSEGSRAPAAGIVAMAIDQRLNDIHPKILKRICIGPIYSSSFSENMDEWLTQLLMFGEDGEQFVFHLTEQFVFSEGSHVVKDRGLLGSILEGKKVREKFYVPKPTSVEEYSEFNELESQKASLIRKTILAPYSIRQHIEDEFKACDLVTFTKEGKINGI